MCLTCWMQNELLHHFIRVARSKLHLMSYSDFVTLVLWNLFDVRLVWVCPDVSCPVRIWMVPRSPSRLCLRFGVGRFLPIPFSASFADHPAKLFSKLKINQDQWHSRVQRTHLKNIMYSYFCTVEHASCFYRDESRVSCHINKLWQNVRSELCVNIDMCVFIRWK